MAETHKVLGQVDPSAATLTDLYTVPGATSTSISSLTVTNRSSIATSFRITIAVGGAADANIQQLYFDVPIPGNETFIATIGMSLAATDKIRVRATLATLTFMATGIEIT